MVLLCDLVSGCGYDLTWECNTYVVICNFWGKIHRIGQNHVYVRKEDGPVVRFSKLLWV